MKVILLYTRIVKKSDDAYKEPLAFEPSTLRFIETYKRFKPIVPHELLVVNCGAEPNDNLFDGIATSYARYDGGGYDCGTYQEIGKNLDCDLVIGLNTHTHFWRSGWLEPFIAARKEGGHGIYGASGSLENTPHLRTPAIGFTPKVISEYPLIAKDRGTASMFEGSTNQNNFSMWAMQSGYRSWYVTDRFRIPLLQCRTVKNGFRNGDQSNCLIWDRHTEIFAKGTPEEKQRLERLADGKYNELRKVVLQTDMSHPD